MTPQGCAAEARFEPGETVGPTGPTLGTKPRDRARPRLRYGAFIEILNDYDLYTPATILRFGLAAGLRLPRVDPAATERRRVRIALSRFSRYHDFAIPGDGMVVLPGQGARAGWFGWRWKRAAKVAVTNPSAKTPDRP